MKEKLFPTALSAILFFILFSLSLSAKSQQMGRVVINEYMPWSGCGTTSEFIELMNFGPGPANIGCFIVTNGKYAVTIPPNTIMQPGEYYVLSGQDVLPKGCGNIDSAVTVQLNWNKVACTNVPIPASGDGLMQDGGNANEKVVLLDANLNIIDAVTRSLPAAPSVTITTNTIDGACGTKTFNLDNMDIAYEALGMSTGKSNSFARKVDGDCGWVKTPQQSAHATNNTGSTASINYEFNLVQAMDCNNSGGAIAIKVAASNVSSLFPMNYTLAFDKDRNNKFDFSDDYIYGTDDTPPYIDVANLPTGKYRITVSSALGCNLKSFDFYILPCQPVLHLKLLSFRLTGSNAQYRTFEYTLDEVESLKSVVLEKSSGNNHFSTAEIIPIGLAGSGIKNFTIATGTEVGYTFFRLRVIGKDGSTILSQVININLPISANTDKLWPNPAREQIFLQLTSATYAKRVFKIFSTQQMVGSGSIEVKPGTNNYPVPVHHLPSGVYNLIILSSGPANQPISFRFVIK